MSEVLPVEDIGDRVPANEPGATGPWALRSGVRASLTAANICIYLIKRRPKHLLDRVTAHAPAEVGISSVTLAELEFGVQKSQAREQNQRALELFGAPFEVLSFDADAAKAYGRVRAELERRGRPIGGMDLMIAAQALSLGATVVTNNTREFARVRGLLVENWSRS